MRDPPIFLAQISNPVIEVVTNSFPSISNAGSLHIISKSGKQNVRLFHTAMRIKEDTLSSCLGISVVYQHATSRHHSLV